MIVQSYNHSRTKWRQTCLWWFFLCLALWGPSLAHRTIVGVPPFKMNLIRARCQAYCNEQFGYQERKIQIDLFHNYQPFMCREKFVSSCTQQIRQEIHFNDCNKCLASIYCSSVCTSGSHILEICLSDCATNCSSECMEDSGNLESCLSDCTANKTVTCRESCQFLRDVYEEESKDVNHYIRARNLTGAAANLTLVQPNVICTYTQLINHTKTPTSFMRIRWNVLDITGHFAAVPLAFVVALKESTNNTSQWSFIGKMNFSVVPIYNLKPNTSYKVKVVAVHWTGFVDKSQESEWIRTPQASAVLEKPVDIRVSRQYIRGGTLRAILEWKPPLNSGGCFFRLYSMPPKGSYDYLETQFWGELRYELKKLMFNSNYTVEILNFDDGYESSSEPAKITFHTIDCLNATDYNYNICAPEEPSNVRLSNAPMYRNQQGRPMSDIYVMWEPPKYSRYRNTISNYTLTYRKAPDMFNARKIEPHRDVVFLPGTATNYTILYCHWDSVYEVSLRAHSPGGHSSEAKIPITLGNGYAEYYETAELSENKAETVTEDKTVQYAATVPVVVGVSAVLFCLVYIRKIKSRKQMGVTKETICREEINPIYECAMTKEESELLVVDEYEIETSALRFTDIVGEGAFGKVIKAELIGTSVISHLPENRIVAVKMLKEHATPDERRNLLLEIEAMKQLGQHRNIVSLIACVTTSSRPCLVMHYCPLGDLRNYLRKHRAKNASRRDYSSEPSSRTSAGCVTLLNSGDSGISYNYRLSNPPKPCTEDPISLHCSQNNSNNTETTDKSDSPLLDGERDTISQNVLLSYARQIALGMEYLAQRKFIHRDLAARNILLYTHRHLKISDFGLARDVYETSVYQPTSARKLPYKWMPIESIFDQIFTIKSDVWSFGILLWEIVTMGGCPYPGIPNQDLFKLLKEGYRMEKPENCSLEIYKMMLSCWHPKPEDRPSFTQLRLTFEKSLEATQVYIDLDVPLCQDCYDHDQDSSNSIGIDQAFGSARVAPEDSRYLTMDGVITTAADVHICHLFHGNSSDRNLTLGAAEGLIIRAEPEEGVLSDSHRLHLDVPSSSNDDCNELGPATNCETECKPRFRSRSELEMTDKDENNVNAENDSLSELTKRQSSQHAHTSSSSTDLTCDCDSADTVSDTSLSSSRNAERVQHAPSLTFGLLSLLSKAGQLRRNRKSQNRQSVSLTDVNSTGGEGLDDRDLGFRPSSSSLAHV